MKWLYSLIIITLLFIFIPRCHASLISKVLTKKNAIVEITAFNQDVINKKIKRTHQSGAGVIIDQDGVIATNLHVIFKKDYIQVTLANGQKHSAKFLTFLAGADIALIKIDVDTPLETINISNSNRVKLNDRVLHVGASHFIRGTISEGQITGLGRGKNPRVSEILQVNLSLYEGDSGGPLLNHKGELIGLITAQMAHQNKRVFAIPSNKIKKTYTKYKNELYNR